MEYKVQKGGRKNIAKKPTGRMEGKGSEQWPSEDRGRGDQKEIGKENG